MSQIVRAEHRQHIALQEQHGRSASNSPHRSRWPARSAPAAPIAADSVGVARPEKMTASTTKVSTVSGMNETSSS